MKDLRPLELSEESLVRRAEDRLREHLLRQGADQVLPSQGELASRLGVSRTVLREAMKRLEAEGLLEIAQGRRCRVKAAGPQASIRSLDAMLRRSEGSLAHLLEVRRPLETEIAGLAAARCGAADLEALDRAVAELEAARSLERRVDADLRFHRLLAEATRNPVFPLLLDTLAGLMRASRYASIGSHGVKAAVDGHREILRAVASRDADAAREAMRRHLRANERQLKDARQW